MPRVGVGVLCWLFPGSMRFIRFAASLCGRCGSSSVRRNSPPRFDRIAWPVALASLMVLSMVANLRHQRGLYDDYRWRTPAVANANLVAHPAVQGDALLFVALMSDGYRSGIQSASATVLSPSSAADRLSLAGANDEEWVEEAGRSSVLLPASWCATPARGENIPDAESPVLSSDGVRELLICAKITVEGVSGFTV